MDQTSVCVLYSKYEGESISNEETPQHTPSKTGICHYINAGQFGLSQRWITHENIKEDITSVLKDRFDIYINLLDGEARASADRIASEYYRIENMRKSLITPPEDFPKSKMLHGMRPSIKALLEPHDVESYQSFSRRYFSMFLQPIGSKAVIMQGPLEYLIEFNTLVSEKQHPRRLRNSNQHELQSRRVERGPEEDCLKSLVYEYLRSEKINSKLFWARLDITIDLATSDIHIDTEVSPDIFPKGGISDDASFIEFYPGSYESFLSILVMSIPSLHVEEAELQQITQDNFDALANDYDYLFSEARHFKVLESLAKTVSWTGDVLDVGCGTGMFGRILHRSQQKCRLRGLDLSASMLKSKAIEIYYESPILIGPMEKLLFSLEAVDHIVCFSVFQYVKPTVFHAILSQMFMLAKMSVTIDVQVIDSEYLAMLSVNSTSTPRKLPFNHVAALRRFGVPSGWKKTFDNLEHSYVEPEFGFDMDSIYVRFEKEI